MKTHLFRFAIIAMMRFALATGSGVALPTAQASASTVLPDAQWSGNTDVITSNVGARGQQYQTPVTSAGTTTTASTRPNDSETAQFVGSTSPNAIVSATAADSFVSSGGSATSNGTLSYYIEVVGPQTGISVPVIFQASAQTTTSNSLYAGASSSAELHLGNGYIAEAASYDGGAEAGFQSSFNVTDEFQLDANSAFMQVEMLVAAGVLSYGQEGGSAGASATLDPYFYIDPSFANASEYSILTSSEIGNSPLSTTPLPSTLWMLLPTLIGISLLGYRRPNIRSS
jgi:hypothetical protein